MTHYKLLPTNYIKVEGEMLLLAAKVRGGC